MNESARCSSCGAELAQDAAPHGLCAACLLKLGLSSTNLMADEVSPAPPDPQREKDRWRFSRRWKFGLIFATAASLALLLAAVLIRDQQPPSPQLGVLRFSLSLANAADFAISPDGRRLAFTATNEDGERLLWLRPLDSFSGTPLAGTEDAVAPFWSPDSRHIGFFARGKLKKADIGSGASEILCDAPAGRDGAWSTEGVIVFNRDLSGNLFLVSGDGGTPEAVTRTDSARAEITHRWPHFLPDGRHFIYTVVAKNGEREGVFINSLDNGQTMRIMSGRAATVYAGGSLIFVRNGMLMAQPFDIADLNTSGDVRPIRYAEQVDRFSVSANGLLVYRKRVERPPVPLAWFDREGRVIGVVDHLTEVEQFALSPDGRKIAASRLGDIWVSELERNVTSRFTFDTAEETFPIWSPDGTRILFLSHRAGQSGIFQKAINAATNEELLLTVPDLEALESSSPDGRFIAYTSRNGEGKSTIGILPLESERKPFTIPSSFNLRDPRFSPDSRWLAYVSDESGRDDIYIETFPPGGSKWKVSVDGGSKPSWRRDGRELFYVSREGMLTSVAIRAGAQSAELSVPSALFRLSWGIGPYEVSAGDRFLMSSHTEDDTSVPLDVVVNWDSEIQR